MWQKNCIVTQWISINQPVALLSNQQHAVLHGQVTPQMLADDPW